MKGKWVVKQLTKQILTEKPKLGIAITEKVDFRGSKIIRNIDRPFIAIKKSVNQK